MHSDGSVNEGIAIDELNRSVSGANIAGNIDNACDAAFEKLRNQRMPVLVKGFIRKVGMCVEKFHKINTPLDNKVKTGNNTMPHGPSDKHKLHFYAAGEGNHFARRQIVLVISLPEICEQDTQFAVCSQPMLRTKPLIGPTPDSFSALPEPFSPKLTTTNAGTCITP